MINNINQIKTSELLSRYAFDNCAIIDVRTPLEFAQSHIPHSINIPVDFLICKPMLYLNRFYTYYLICKTGDRSSRACKELQKQNYSVIYVCGGIDEWTGPIERDRGF